MLICPHCKSNNTKKKGRTKLGYQQYYCKDCKQHWSDNPNGQGRPTIGLTVMTDAQRAQKYRASKK
jgi:transposase-like protein